MKKKSKRRNRKSKYTFVDEYKFRYYFQGLTLDNDDIGVLDKALVSLDDTTRLPSKLVQHNTANGFSGAPCLTDNQIIVSISKFFSEGKGPASLAQVTEEKRFPCLPAALHINLRSPSLDIPQRVEISLHQILKGLPKPDGTYMVYLHGLTMEDGSEYVYYGVTKRGWMNRFNEHMRDALRDDSQLLFHRIFREAILGRADQLFGQTKNEPASENCARILAGNHHVVCAAGLSEADALQTEEYLVAKHSFGKSNGLNMIPGGKAGLAYLHKLNILPRKKRLVDTDDKEKLYGSYLRDNPRKGIANPAIAERWKDSEYAAKIICGGKRRLSVEQVLTIREAAQEGMTVEEIQSLVDANDSAQVRRVIQGKTYSRIE